jgi:hypothetical protein
MPLEYLYWGEGGIQASNQGYVESRVKQEENGDHPLLSCGFSE